MPRTPSRQQNGQLGPINPAGSARAVPPMLLRQQGPAQALEHFSGADIPPAIARALNAIQENLRQALGQAKGSPFANGSLLENVALVGGTTKVLNHGLGIPFRGYMLGKQSNYAYVALVANSASALDQAQIQLVSSVNVTLDVWVYG
jgi:hypothetical protein